MKFLNELPTLTRMWLTIGVTAAAGWVASLLVLHGVITNTEASTDVQAVVPTAVFAGTILLGVVVHKFVAPAVRAVESLAARLVQRDAPAASPFVQRVSGAVDDALAALEAPAVGVSPAAAPATVTAKLSAVESVDGE